MVDPLVEVPIGAMNSAGRQVFRLLSRLRDELKSTAPVALLISALVCLIATA
ncbi:MAG: hypothetical protein R2865_00680 [Deinococcales bacterium]